MLTLNELRFCLPSTKSFLGVNETLDKKSRVKDDLILKGWIFKVEAVLNIKFVDFWENVEPYEGLLSNQYLGFS